MKSSHHGGSDLLPETLREWAGYICGILLAFGGVVWMISAGLSEVSRFPKVEMLATTRMVLVGACIMMLGCFIVLAVEKYQANRTRAARNADPQIPS